MSRPGWWAWERAVRQHAPTEGAYATAMTWAAQCWNWRAVDERPDEFRAQPMLLSDLAGVHPVAIGASTLRRRLKQLQEAGLIERLRGHSRWSPDVFAPTTPALNSARERAVFEANSAHEGAVLDLNSARERAVFEANSAHHEQQQRSPDAGPLSSPETPETPRTHTHTRTREAVASSGGITDDGRTAMRYLLLSMDARWGEGTSGGLAPGFQQQATARLSELRAAGWHESDLINKLNAREWSSAGSVGRTLMARLRDFEGLVPPLSAAERARERMAEQRNREVARCPHGTPGGRRGCPLCRAQVAPDDEPVEALTPEEALALARSSLRGQ